MNSDPASHTSGDDIQAAFAYHKSGHFKQAKEIYQRLLEKDPQDYNALQLLGTIFISEGEYHSALEVIVRAVRVFDKDPSAYNNLGEAYRGLNRLDDAEVCFRRAVGLDSGYSIAWNSLSVVLQARKNHGEALAACRHAISLSPDYAEAYNNLGIVLADMSRYGEAEVAYRHAAALADCYIAPLVNLGILLKNTRRYEEAENEYIKAVDRDPGADIAAYNLAILKLLRGDLLQGFTLYEKRLENLGILSQAPECCPVWRGEGLDGRSILIITEQGAGDTLMMLRYLRMLKERHRAAKIGVQCGEPLRRIVLSVPAVDVHHPATEAPPFQSYDCFSSMMSLPYQFKTELGTIPSNNRYLSVPPHLRATWSEIRGLQGVKVGIAWAGNKELEADSRRSVPLQAFQPMFAISGVYFLSLQKGEASEQQKQVEFALIDLMDRCEDFLDTAALVSELDLVISVDTAVAHLAGALGKPVWLLNRFESEWRWMTGRSDSPWYDSMRIFNQTEPGNWENVIEQIIAELNNRICTQWSEAATD